MPRNVAAVVLSEEQQRQLEQWVAALGTPQQVALRCRIILGVAAGRSEVAVAADNQVNRVRLWRDRFVLQGIEGLRVFAPGRGRKATYGRERIKPMIDATLQLKARWNLQLPTPLLLRSAQSCSEILD